MTDKPFNPRYLQRLNRPHANPSPLAPGDIRSLGFPAELSETMARIYNFDFMSTEDSMWEKVPAGFVMAHTSIRDGKYDEKTVDIAVGTSRQTVYILAPKEFMDQSVQFVTEEGIRPHEGLPNPTKFQQAVSGDRPRLCGWLDIESGFFFFIDKTMFEGTKKLLGFDDPGPEQAAKPPSPSPA